MFGRSACIVAVVANAAPGDHPDDVIALTAFGQATKSSKWDTKGYWLRTDKSVCKWDGVSCNADGRVQGLKLKDKGLDGALPAELALLSELESFVMRCKRPVGYKGCGVNNFHNSSLAPLSKLSKLKDLDVEYTCTGGSLDGIEGLKSIESFQVHGNYISGTIPETIGELTNIQTLKLGRNPITGTLPAITTLKKVVQFNCNFCALHGQFPDIFGELSSLEISYWDGNGFSGTLPSSLGQAKKLKRVSFNINNLTGPLPAGLCDVPAGQSGGDCRIGSDTELEPYEADYPWLLPVSGNFYDCADGVAPCFQQEGVCNTTHMYPSAAQNYSIIRCSDAAIV